MPDTFKSTSDQLKQLDAIQVPKEAPSSTAPASIQKSSVELIQELPNAPVGLPGMPWKRNDDRRRNLLIKSIEADLIQSQKSGITQSIIEQDIIIGNSFLATYDRKTFEFAREKLARDDKLHSLPSHSPEYQAQKHICAMKDKEEQQFLDTLTNPRNFKKLHDNALSQNLTERIRALTDVAEPQPAPAATRPQARISRHAVNNTNKSDALATRNQEIQDRNLAIRNDIAKKVKSVEQTVDRINQLKPEINNSQIVKTTLKSATPAVSNKGEKQEQKNKWLKPAAVRVGSVGGHAFGVVTEKIGKTIGSIIKAAALGAWDLAKAAAGKIAQLTKSSEALTIENKQAEMQEMTNKPAPISISKSPKPSSGPSMYVQATEWLGGAIGWSIATALDGGVRLAAFGINKVIEVIPQLYDSLTTSHENAADKKNIKVVQQQPANQYVTGQEGDYQTDPNKFKKNNDDLLKIAGNTITNTPSPAKDNDQDKDNQFDDTLPTFNHR